MPSHQPQRRASTQPRGDPPAIQSPRCVLSALRMWLGAPQGGARWAGAAARRQRPTLCGCGAAPTRCHRACSRSITDSSRGPRYRAVTAYSSASCFWRSFWCSSCTQRGWIRVGGWEWDQGKGGGVVERVGGGQALGLGWQECGKPAMRASWDATRHVPPDRLPTAGVQARWCECLPHGSTASSHTRATIARAQRGV